MTTPHINAAPGDFADTVLMPGDPLRAQYIADKFLADVTQVNSVRNMLGYTGYYKGQRVSIMGSGMGIPSISIYAKELITEFGVKNIIRIGSCGALQADMGLGDVVIALGAGTDSGVNRMRIDGFDFAAIADFGLVQASVTAANKVAAKVWVGNAFSCDLFYSPLENFIATLIKMNILAVEMEAAGLYGVAAEYGAKALAMMTVSDHMIHKQAMSAEQRQTSFADMMAIALDTALTI